ncbi:MAG TPA: hypothetical protein PLU11_02100, partial [Chitinophagaceae bacterium]|nr:hypothetical protein [Chitinophagaceae bacterium]
EICVYLRFHLRHLRDCILVVEGLRDEGKSRSYQQHPLSTPLLASSFLLLAFFLASCFSLTSGIFAVLL